MDIIPDFLMKKIYKKGSLKETKDGIVFNLKNILGPGIITGINFIKINDEIYKSSVIKIITKEFSTIAENINADNPVLFKLNQEITCLLEDAQGLKEGLNKIIVELISKEVGSVQVTLTDIL